MHVIHFLRCLSTEPVAKSAQDAKVDEILECNYAIIPEHHNAGKYFNVISFNIRQN